MVENFPGRERPVEVTTSLSELLWALTDLERQLSLGLGVALSEENVTLEQWRTLEAIARLDSPTMGELADATGMANASLSRTVDSLEDSATAYRLPAASDRRRITVLLSDRGVQRLARVRAIVASWERATQKRLGPDAAAALVTATDEAARALADGPRASS